VQWKRFASDKEWRGAGGQEGSVGEEVCFTPFLAPGQMQPSVAPQTKAVASPMVAADLPKVVKSGLLEPGQVASLESLVRDAKILGVVVLEDVKGDGGWQNGRVAQNAQISHRRGPAGAEHDEVFDMRVFNGQPPLGGWWALPEDVQEMRGSAVAIAQKAQADAKDMFDDPAPPVLHAKHPRKRQEEAEEENATDRSHQPVVDAEGHVSMAIGDLVAVLLGEQEAGWHFAIGEYRGAPLDSEDPEEEEEETGEQEEGKGDGDDDVAMVVQWYGNNTAEASRYGPNSTYWPGWRDSADLQHPLTFCAKRPKVWSCFGSCVLDTLRLFLRVLSCCMASFWKKESSSLRPKGR